MVARRRTGRGKQDLGAPGSRRPYLGRIPVPTKPEQVITPKPKRSDRTAEKRRLRRAARDPDEA